ncbi:MAG: DUF86 domain-containing protein [Caldilineaceae bacterium]|nr:DUF86 domain-containing protein [Caldilineaceae bacterium]
MRLEARKYLFDIRSAADLLAEFLAGKTFADYQRVIAFRNILIHGYSDVDDGLVWDVVETNLPLLRHEVERLLNDE